MANESLPNPIPIDNLVFGEKPRHPLFIDLTGQRFQRLTVLGFKGRERLHSFWWCRCDCGNICSPSSNALRSGNSRSCGCLKLDIATGRLKTHGQTNSPEYYAWRNMINRCTNPKVENYDRYGGRGIAVCDRWLHSFADFIADMGPKPSSEHSIDRKNNNGNYEPNNCHWATPTEQANNRRPRSK